jgi:photosystem II stability/assembly factor-like uncharacterized protein
MKRCLCSALVFLAALTSAFGQSADKIGKLYEKLSWRSIGPAVMGGRTVDIEALESKPWVIYAAVGPSGVWKSSNNGITWEAVFNKEATVSVGDLAVSQSQPDIVWVGSGEATCRNSVTIGDGVYKSTDAGKTWTNMGLKDTRHISRVVINRGDPNIVYVAAMGHLWGPNSERGVFKTIDGGKTWTKVLYIDVNTGIADLAMDPSDSLTLYAAAYEYRRRPYLYTSGGPGSGLYKTTDGGATWKKLSQGLPSGILGRIGIDVSRSNPRVVYALVEAAEPGIFRSEDKGETWKRTGEPAVFRQVNNRPFYYSQVRVDPTDDKVIYVFSVGSHVSDNMGKSFRTISAGTHPDHHALWIDPSNPLHLIDGNDGGIDITYDQGKNWYDVANIPAAEVYEVGADRQDPYRVYCGLQDNGVWGGPSASLDPAGIVNSDWSCINGGDGFFVQPDPSEPWLVYSNSQMDGLALSDARMGRNRSIRPEAPLTEPPYRYNWKSPVLVSPHDPKTVYTAGNFLFRTRDGGRTWDRISPDLTTNNPEEMVDSGGPLSPENTGAEIHCTIVTVAESPVSAGVIWCGTDDGNLQVTRDGGKTWTNVVRNIPGLPAGTWCSRVEASHFEAGAAYAAFDGHRTDDTSTYLFKTADYGRTWTSLRGNLPFGWVHVVREDPRNRNLLFAGLEFGLHASLDGGRSWFSLRNDMPTASVQDILIHPVRHDLIIGTHGAGIWILDDIAPLEEMNDRVLDSDLFLFSPRPVVEFLLSSQGESFTRPAYSGANPTPGLLLTYYCKAPTKERPTLHVRDAKGEEVFMISQAIKEGLQRVSWNLEYLPRNEKGQKPAATGFGLAALPLVSPGEYTVELEAGAGAAKAARPARIEPDPRFSWPESSRREQGRFLVDVLSVNRTLALCVTGAAGVRRDLDDAVKEAAGRKDLPPGVTSALKGFGDRFQVLEGAIKPQNFAAPGSRETALRGGSLSQMLLMLGMAVKGYPDRPTDSQQEQLAGITRAVLELTERWNAFASSEVPALNQVLQANNLKTLRVPAKVE